jgi:hypothetical protein
VDTLWAWRSVKQIAKQPKTNTRLRIYSFNNAVSEGNVAQQTLTNPSIQIEMSNLLTFAQAELAQYHTKSTYLSSFIKPNIHKGQHNDFTIAPINHRFDSRPYIGPLFCLVRRYHPRRRWYRSASSPHANRLFCKPRTSSCRNR